MQLSYGIKTAPSKASAEAILRHIITITTPLIYSFPSISKPAFVSGTIFACNSVWKFQYHGKNHEAGIGID
jgi:hypothetical protein